MLSRRIVTIASLSMLVSPALTQSRESAEVWRDPNCGCCAGWVAHLREEGFAVTDRIVPSVTPIRRMLGTPSDLLSCHAARIAGWLKIEGHVPALAIRRALAETLPGVVGLAVPAMPIGTPGMEVPGHEAEVYDVIAWRADGSHFAWLRMRGAKLA
jgi:hypothetical protein